jgi:Uncharacterized protein SCO1/SenC/PrrC, involved in biogenesis of respiratory and photosynthetic systems
MRRTLLLLAALSVLAVAGAGRAALAANAPEAAHAAPGAMPGSMSGAMDNASAMPAHMHPAPQEGEKKDGKKDGPPGVRKGTAKDDDDDAAVVEKIGQHAALDVELTGEDGARLRLADLVTMPTIIAPVYYSCPNECNVLLGTLGQVLPEVGLRPGVDYQVLAISFDELDTPATATKRKGDFLNTTSAGFPPQAWRFLTGDEKNVRRLMDSLGFSYARTPTGFRHSVVLIALTPTGKISRYLYGIRPLAFDIAMAATEAGAEKTGLSVKRAIAMCYTYDPQGRRYVFDIVKVTGAGVLFALALFGLFLAFGGKRRPKP